MQVHFSARRKLLIAFNELPLLRDVGLVSTLVGTKSAPKSPLPITQYTSSILFGTSYPPYTNLFLCLSKIPWLLVPTLGHADRRVLWIPLIYLLTFSSTGCQNIVLGQGAKKEGERHGDSTMVKRDEGKVWTEVGFLVQRDLASRWTQNLSSSLSGRWCGDDQARM